MSVQLPNDRAAKMKVKIFILFFGSLIIPVIYGILVSVSGVDSNGSEGSSTRTRIYQFVNGIIAANDSPLLGYGAGHADEVIFEIGQYNNSAMLYIPTIDNLFLSKLVESGYFSLILYFMLLFIPLLLMLKIERSSISIVLASSIVSSIVTMFTLSIFTILPLIFLILGLSLVYAKRITL
jgi:O-antigen ligase